MSTEKLSITSTLPLHSTATQIPRLGFGVYLSPANTCEQSCLSALTTGYRHIDTAQFYGNESQVGSALAASNLPRSAVFITTKILSAAGSVEKSYQKCLDSVRKIDPREDGYVDQFLIHSPNAGSKVRKELWQALERLYDEGRAKSIGVSNFGIGHIQELKAFAKVWPPHVNQIELHPWCQQREIVAYSQDHHIVISAYSPLVRNYKANDPTLSSLSQKYNKSTAQILIRYSLQKNWVPLPKSDNPEYIRSNADVFDFEIDEADVERLDALDEGEKGAIVQAVDND